MFAERNLRHVRFETRDGRKGWEADAPYDRIVAWTTPDHLPNAWNQQLADGGIIVAPFQVLPLANTTVVVRLRKEHTTLKGGDVIQGSYIAMTSEPVNKFFGPWIHAEWVGEGNDPWWISSRWMKEAAPDAWIEQFLQAKPTPSPYPEAGKDLRPFLLAQNPNGLTTAYCPDDHWIGYSCPHGFALASVYGDLWLVSNEKYADVLHGWWKKWNQQGNPSYDQLEAMVVGNQVTVKLKST
jgi:protein-L-isoaspartate(D-aspartate) O-methyltransferase